MAEQSASQYSAGQVITAALHPLPANCLGVIASAAQRFSTHARVAIAGDALKNQHNLHASEDDIAFVFDKIDTCIPDLLKGVPAEVQERVEVWPCRDCCDCGRKFGSHRLHIPMVVYSSEDGKTHGSAVELHCDSCGVFFTGQWCYERHDRRHGKPLSNLRFLTDSSMGDIFVLPTPGLHSVAACSAKDLRLISASLHHARGSFTAAAEIFADRSRCPELHDDGTAISH